MDCGLGMFSAGIALPFIGDAFVFTGRNAGIKITFVSLFWFHRPVGATLCTDYRQIWHR